MGGGGKFLRAGRMEVPNATMLDLIRLAYGYTYTPERVLEGPNWVEMEHYDIVAKLPPGTSEENQELMLQALLKDRFSLAVRKEDRPLPAYFLVSGKKPLLKEANGTGDTGCKPKAASGPPTEGGMRIGMNGVQIALGPGGTIEYNCRNVTMEAFASGLRGMLGAFEFGQNPIKDETGIKGTWNFDVHWSIGFIGMPGEPGERVTVPDAIEKQLGLKLEQRPVSTPVIVIESVNRKPTDNVANIAELLPPVKTSVEFEVADVKPSVPGGRGGGSRNQPGGRFTGTNMALSTLVLRAFNAFNNEEVVGVPDWSMPERFDIVAKASTEPGQPVLDQQTLSLMIRSLLADRFKMTWHTEDRPVTTYDLVAGKPKMKKADPKERSTSKMVDAPPGWAPGSQSMVFHDITMEQFAEQLTGMAQGLNWPVTDLTELEGGYDFTLTYSRFPGMAMAGPGRGGDNGATASDPTGALTIFEAVEKQLGLKLVAHKRNMPVTVIDHLEQKPTDN